MMTWIAIVFLWFSVGVNTLVTLFALGKALRTEQRLKDLEIAHAKKFAERVEPRWN